MDRAPPVPLKTFLIRSSKHILGWDLEVCHGVVASSQHRPVDAVCTVTYGWGFISFFAVILHFMLNLVAPISLAVCSYHAAEVSRFVISAPPHRCRWDLRSSGILTQRIAGSTVRCVISQKSADLNSYDGSVCFSLVPCVDFGILGWFKLSKTAWLQFWLIIYPAIFTFLRCRGKSFVR
jgi:hypothetical protein